MAVTIRKLVPLSQPKPQYNANMPKLVLPPVKKYVPEMPPLFEDMQLKEKPFHQNDYLKNNVNRNININALTQKNTPYNSFIKQQETYKAANPDKPSILKLVGDNAIAGLSGFNKGLAQTADMFLPDFITPQTVQDGLNHYKKLGDSYANTAAKTNESYGTAGKVAGGLISGVTGAVPNSVLAYLTAGTSTAPQLGASASGALNTIGASFKELAKNPMFWTSFMRSTGGTYEQAKAEGANELQAQATAILNGFLGAGVEVGGGIETFPKTKGGVAEWVKSMIEEGNEEVIQSVIEKATKKVVYDTDKPLVSMTDENAVINPIDEIKNFATGAVSAAVLSGGQAAAKNFPNVVEPLVGSHTVNSIVKNQGIHDMRTQGINPITSGTKLDNSYILQKQDFSKVNVPQSNVILPKPLDVSGKIGVQGIPVIKSQYDMPKMQIPRKSKPLELPSSRMYASPNGIITDSLPVKNQSTDNVINHVEKFGSDILEDDYENNIFSALSDEEVRDANEIIKLSQGANMSPTDFIDAFNESDEKAINKQIDDLAKDLAAYKGKGSSIIPIKQDYGADNTGYRVSNNDEWYRDFYAQFGRAPKKSEFKGIADSLIHEDIKRGGGQYLSPEMAQSYSYMQKLKATVSKMGENAVNLTNDYGGTIVERGRVRQEIQPKYSPVNARQIITPNGRVLGKGAEQPLDFMKLSEQNKVNNFVDNASLQSTEKQPINTDTFGTHSIGAAERNPNSYSAMQNKYGTIKPGENPFRVVDVPKQTADDNRTRQYLRTAMEAEATPEKMIEDFEKHAAMGDFSYKPKNDKESLNNAINTIKTTGFGKALEQWESGINGHRQSTKDDMVLGQVLYSQAANAGDTELALKLAAEIAAEGTRMGQGIQALRMLKKLTPDGKLYYAQKSVECIKKEVAETFGSKAPDIKIDDALAKNLLQAKNPKEIEVAEEAIFQNIADQVPATWLDKWNAWRYLSMLGNFKTHIRNLIGNAVFVPAVKIKNMIALPMEKAFIKNSDKTKAFVTLTDKPFKQFAKADFAEMESIITGTGKMNPSSMIKERQTIFKLKPLEWLRVFNGKMLNAEDAFFLKRAYTDSMAQYMKSNKYSVDFLKGNTQESRIALEKARRYAIDEAQKATYRDANALAEMLSKFTAIKKSDNIGMKAVKVGVEGVLPFKKTPMNIVKRGVEYSPLGLIKGLSDAALKIKKGNITAAEAIDEIAAGLTGSGIMAIGAWLASMGIVTGGKEEDKKEESFDALQGNQNYAIQIGDVSYTIDWLAPVALPLFIGVEVYNSFEQSSGSNKPFADIADQLTRIAEPMLNLTMLQGINNSIKSASYGKNPLTEVGLNAFTNYVGQGVPTALGQLARSVDGTRRTTYIDKNSNLPEFIDAPLQRNAAKIPFASKTLSKRIDQWGREQKNAGDNFFGRLAYNALSPGYYSKTNPTSVDKEIQKLYKKTGEKDVLPNYAAKKIIQNGETHNFSAKEYEEFAIKRGKLRYDLVDTFLKDAGYRNLSDEEKIEVIKKAYDAANNIAKKEVVKSVPATKEYTVYKDKTVDLSQYLLFKKTASTDGNNSVSKAEAQAALDMSDLSTEQKAYIWALDKISIEKNNPYK